MLPSTLLKNIALPHPTAVVLILIKTTSTLKNWLSQLNCHNHVAMTGNVIIDLFLEMYKSFVLCKQGSFGQTCLKLLFQMRLFIFNFDHILI